MKAYADVEVFFAEYFFEAFGADVTPVAVEPMPLRAPEPALVMVEPVKVPVVLMTRKLAGSDDTSPAVISNSHCRVLGLNHCTCVVGPQVISH